MPPKTNENGQIYPWAMEGYDINTPHMTMKLNNFSTDLAKVIGKEKEALVLSDSLNQLSDKHSDYADAETGLTDVEVFEKYLKDNKIVGLRTDGNKVELKPTKRSTRYVNFAREGEAEPLRESIDGIAKIVRETADFYRDQYKDRTDETGRRYNEKAQNLADWYEKTAKAYDPEEGDLIEAEFHAPYINILNEMFGGAPKLGSIPFEECVGVLDQEGIPGGKPIFDDYITVMSVGVEETLIQYERQKGEKEGWTAEKEQKYLGDLRRTHAKAVEAFDRIWAVDDKGQYDSVLNNELVHLTGKSSKETRDPNDMFGYMRGEVRAIDMGYDSKHLYVLGQVGLQEQVLKKLSESLKRDIEKEKDPRTLDDLTEKLNRIDQYTAEFNDFKDSIWNTHVTGKDDMEKIGDKVDDFFKSHEALYGDLQSHRGGIEETLSYNREEAKKAGPMPTPAFNALDVDALIDAATQVFSGDTNDPFLEKMQKVVTGKHDADGKYSPEANDDVKDFARDVSAKYVERMAEASKYATEHPESADAKMFEINILNTKKVYADNIASGIPMPRGESARYRDVSFDKLSSINAQMSADAFSPEKIAVTQKAVVELGLNDFAQKTFELQEKHQRFELNKDRMTLDERTTFLNDIKADKKVVIEMAKSIQMKMEKPSPEVKEFFVNDGQRLDYMGSRGLQGLIDDYSKDIMKTDDLLKDDLSAALDKFNTEKTGLFKSESAEHLALKENAEALRKNIEVLSSGAVQEGKTSRAITEEEKNKLLKDTLTQASALKMSAERYISHASPDGKEPFTDAGKRRLEGAREIKDFANRLDKILDKQQGVAELKAQMNETLKKMEAADEPELRENVKDPLSSIKNRVNGWYDKIKAVDFNMLGKGSDEFAGIVEDMKKLKEFTDNALKADEKGRINTEKLLTLHEKETSVIDKLQNYIDRKEEQIKNDPQRRDDPGKQKREQPRIRTAIGLLVEMKKDTLEQTNMVVENLQEKVRPKVEKMLEAEDKIRSANGISHDDYIKSSYRSLNLINNLDGKKWNIGEKETLRHYCERIQSYADKQTYDKDKQYILDDRSNPGRNVLKEANKLFKEKDSKKLTNDDLKEKFSADRQNYEKTPKKFDLAGKKAELDNRAKKLKETLVSKQKKEPVKKNASAAKK